MRRWVGMILMLAACGSSTEPTSETDGVTTSSDASTSVSTTSGESTSTNGDATTTGPSPGTTGDGTDTSGGTTGESSAFPCEDFDAFVATLEGVDPQAAAAMAREELATLVYSELGLPLRCADGRVGFVAYLEDVSAPTVAGEFNDWDAAALPTTQPVGGVPLFVAYAELDDSAGGFPYKFVLDGTEFFADPSARRFDWDEFGEYSLTAARPGRGHHERWPDFEEGIGTLDPRNVTAWVPPDLAAGSPVPVLYMHDGQNLFDPDGAFGSWGASVTAQAAIEAGDVAPFLIVGIDNTADRFDEYSHTTDNPGGGPVGGRGDEYTEFIASGLKPFIDGRYPTLTDPGSTGIMGSSMGGLISLYAAWLRPDVFGFAGAMSGTLWWGEGSNSDTIIDLYASQPPDGLVIYLDSGGGPPCPGGADNYCEVIQLRDTLVTEGWTEDADLFYEWAPNAPHNEGAWAARFGGSLQTWFPGSGG
jgi:predicted alpha/beta superfamily hydrolase